MTKDELDALIAEWPCFGCVGTLAQVVELLLLRQWLLTLDPDADTTVQGLLDAAGCLVCLSGNLYEQLKLALTYLISEAA